MQRHRVAIRLCTPLGACADAARADGLRTRPRYLIARACPSVCAHKRHIAICVCTPTARDHLRQLLLRFRSSRHRRACGRIPQATHASQPVTAASYRRQCRACATCSEHLHARIRWLATRMVMPPKQVATHVPRVYDVAGVILIAIAWLLQHVRVSSSCDAEGI